ncbi:unnamed protein product [Rotaria sp. Silwood1]|nr:unnamed protein product [Rotaria sp. Silwood1]
MLKTDEFRVVSQTSNLHPTETTTDAPTHTNGFYMPPAKRRRLQGTLTDLLISEYQRLAWEALKEIINDQVNEVNKSNLSTIIYELLKYNIIRGRGLLANAIIRAQIRSPSSTPVYVALVSYIHRKFPLISELICKRLISSFRQTYQRNDKINCLTTTKFVAHLINQNILHEIIALQILLFLFENSTDDNIELAVELLKECGQKLLQVSRPELDSAFLVLRNLLHQSSLNKHTQDMIRNLFTVRRDEFKEYSTIQSGLNLVDKNDQYIHILQLGVFYDSESMLDVFKYDEEYEVNENKYEQIRKRILDENESSSNSSDSDEEDNANEEKQQLRITDQTETDLIILRHKICLTIQTNIDAKKCAHKLLKMNLHYRRKKELCQMIVDICAQQHTYEDFFGLVGEHICLSKQGYVYWFKQIFQDQYDISRWPKNVKLNNVAKFFAHLLVTDSISWDVFDCIYLSEKNSTSSSRIYMKILFLELFQFLGFTKLKNRLTDPTLRNSFRGVFLRDTPENARFCIKFFTSIGLDKMKTSKNDLLSFLLGDRIKVCEGQLRNFPDTTVSIHGYSTRILLKHEALKDEFSFKANQLRIYLSLRNGVMSFKWKI